MDIKPIQTEYKGYKFRSRLEARWAVFFDKAGIPYEYEPEGFDLGSLGWYLPDFYLPWFDAYVEIKPKYSDQLDDAGKKLMRLFENTTHAVLLCVGDPMDDEMYTLCNDLCDSGGGGPLRKEARFIKGVYFKTIVYISNGRVHCYSSSSSSSSEEWLAASGKHKVLLAIGGRLERVDRVFCLSNWEEIKSSASMGHVHSYRDDFSDAKKAARQARFEHGEGG